MRNVLIIAVLCCLFSCKKIDKIHKPNNLIDEKVLVDILTDAAIYSAAKSQDKRMLEAKNVDMQVFLKEKYNIDTLTLRENINYYASDLERYQKIQGKVKDILEAKKKVVDELNKKEDEARKKKMEEKKQSHKGNDSTFKKVQRLKEITAKN